MRFCPLLQYLQQDKPCRLLSGLLEVITIDLSQRYRNIYVSKAGHWHFKTDAIPSYKPWGRSLHTWVQADVKT
jgi:hypothetical protein